MFTFTSGRRITINGWYKVIANYAQLTIQSCFQSLQNCSAFTGATGNLRRPNSLEDTLVRNQPAHKEQNLCVGAMFSYDMLNVLWVTIPCAELFHASFVCEKAADNLPLYTRMISSNITTSFQWRHSINQAFVFVLEKPIVNCPYPWLAADYTCVFLIRAETPTELSKEVLSSHCHSINASLYEFPLHYFNMGIYYSGIDSKGDIFYTIKVALMLNQESEAMMGVDQPGGCSMVNIPKDAAIWKNCSLVNMKGFAETILIACVKNFDSSVISYEMMSVFKCQDGNLIAEAFRCDGVVQCPSGNDEQNCAVFKATSIDCSPFSLHAHKNEKCVNKCPDLYVPCANGRCILLDAICNNYKDCDDGWDELICTMSQWDSNLHLSLNNFVGKTSTSTYQCSDGTSYDASGFCVFDIAEMNTLLFCDDGSHLVQCTHVGCSNAFKCINSFCIPIRRLCDGVIDCPHGDDELGCDQFICTGLLQCRESNICVPPWEVCDGIVHCVPFKEDEMYCAPCPLGMACKGNSALCDNVLDLHINDSLSDLEMYTPKTLTCKNSSTFSKLIQTVCMSGLIVLDVQSNFLSSGEVFSLIRNLTHLTFLNAAFNMIQTISSENQINYQMKILNLSFNNIKVLQNFVFKYFPNLMTLVLNDNLLSAIEVNSLSYLKHLLAIDLTNNPLMMVAVSDLPSMSPLLNHVESDLWFICCLLPDVHNCKPQMEQLSSCTNLLHAVLHRVLIIAQAVLTFMTNSAVIVLSSHLHSRERSQMLHLTTANLIMSCYLTLISSVDAYYRDTFSKISMLWKHLDLCKVAASFNMIGFEVSLTIILYISLYRAYSIYFSWKRFSKKLTLKMCFSIWIIWIIYVIVFVNLLNIFDIPVASNICIFVFFDQHIENNLILIHSYIFVLVNIMIIFLIVVSYSLIAWSVLGKPMDFNPVNGQLRQRKRSLLVRLFAIFFFSCICWLPVLVSSIISLLGFPLGESLPVWMAILVIPINSSFYPVMFCLIPVIGNLRNKQLIKCNFSK